MATFTFIVIGGGIAGVSCVQQLSATCDKESILLISGSPLVKAVSNFKQISHTLEEFDVAEKPISKIQAELPNVTVIHDEVTGLASDKHVLSTRSGKSFTYQKVCICAGAQPKLIGQGNNHHVIGIRDTESVQVFQQKLVGARCIVVVGNGGIATELVYEIENCDVIWAIKDDAISAAFFDVGAAQFFLPHLDANKAAIEKPLKRTKYTVGGAAVAAGASSSASCHATHGSALGPDWSVKLRMSGAADETQKVHVEYKCEVESVFTKDEMQASNKPSGDDEGVWPVYVRLTNGKLYGCDFVVSATGVKPNVAPFLLGNLFDIASDGGIKVHKDMSTSVSDVFAAGDICSACWDHSPHWFQMRLWTQARQMGHYAAKCMLASLESLPIDLDFCFELFTHVTKFFGYKVVLLGKYNAQGISTEQYTCILRTTKALEYVKCVMVNGRMQGAVVVGDCDLEETFENLILNQMDLGRFGENLLDPGVDIEDYFD